MIGDNIHDPVKAIPNLVGDPVPSLGAACSRVVNRDKVVKFTKEKAISYPVEDELYRRLSRVIEEYQNISSVAVLGILEALKYQCMPDSKE